MKATKIIAVLAVALMAGTMGLTSCSKGKGGSGKVKGELLPEGNFKVELTEDGGGIILTDYDMKDWKKDDKGKYVKKDVRFPSTVQGLPVKKILFDTSASFKQAITGLVIPEGVEVVGGFGFSDLTFVSLPSTLKALAPSAFTSCHKLAVCNLPEGLEYIGKDAFETTALTSVSLPKSLKYIEYFPFYKCNNLTEINIPEGFNAAFYSTYVEDAEMALTAFFRGDGIDKSLALQKLVKETKIKVVKEDLDTEGLYGFKNY